MTAPRIEQFGAATLYRGDWRDHIEEIGPVDHTFADPPYGAFMHAAKAAKRARPLRNDGGPELIPLEFESIEGQREEVAAAWCAQTNGWILTFCEPEAVGDWRWALMAAGARYKRACFWFKVGATPQMNGQGPGMGVEAFTSAWCGPGHSSWNGGGRGNKFEHPVPRKPRGRERHSTEKPVSLMEEITVLFSNPGQRICDPFMGSGTTGVAALRTGRAFVGVEVYQKYFDLACKRLEMAADDGVQTDFFEYRKPVQNRMDLAVPS